MTIGLWPDSTAFWCARRVIVTGGVGFLGAEVVRRLRAHSATEVIVPRREDYDLREREAVRRLFDDAGPADVVIHLAANVGGIGYNLAHPGELFYDNIMTGTLMIDEARRAKSGKFVAVGTICAYPKFTPVPFHEDCLWDGYPEETNAPYGLAKKMLLVQAQAYRQQYDFNAIYLLPVNLYGPRDNFDPASSHVIPALVKKCVDAAAEGLAEIVVWGDGSPTREFLFVEDAAEGIVLAAERYDGAAPINLGSAFEISIKDLVDAIVQGTGYPGRVVLGVSKLSCQPRRKLDVSRDKALFDFRAETGFEERLRRTVEWYRASIETVEERVFA